MRQVYTFFIHDEDPDSVTFGCVADSQGEAELKCRAVGYRDFSLAEIRPLASDETDEHVNYLIRSNPFVGEQWLPLIEALRILIDAHAINRVRPAWTINTYAATYEFNPNRSPFVQGIVESDGALHIELSGDLHANPRFTQAQREQLEFIGWEQPEELERFDLYVLMLEPGWSSRYAAERIIETLVAVLRFDTDSAFGLSRDDSINSEIALASGMVPRSQAEKEDVPRIFCLPDSEIARWTDETQDEKSHDEVNHEESTPKRKDGHMNESDETTLSWGSQLDPFYSEEHWDDVLSVNAAIFESKDGETLLEVAPYIFLRFNGEFAPEIDDFYFIPFPERSIDSRQFKVLSPQRQCFNFTPDFFQFIVDFAISAIETEFPYLQNGIARVEQIRPLFIAYLLGTSAHDAYGDSLWDVAQIVEHEVSHRIAPMMGLHEQKFPELHHVLSGASVLSFIPSYGFANFYREINANDLECWGVSAEVRDVLSPFWSDIYLIDDIEISERVLQRESDIEHNTLAKVVRLAQIRHDLSRELSDYIDLNDWASRKAMSLTSEARTLLGDSRADINHWFGFDARRSQNFSCMSIPRVGGIASEEEARRMLAEAYALIRVGEEVRLGTKWESRLLANVIIEFWRVTGYTDEARKIGLITTSSPRDGITLPVFGDDESDGLFDGYELPPMYARVMAERVTAIIRSPRKTDQLMSLWAGDVSMSDTGRIDELAFAMLVQMGHDGPDYLGGGFWPGAFKDIYGALHNNVMPWNHIESAIETKIREHGFMLKHEHRFFVPADSIREIFWLFARKPGTSNYLIDSFRNLIGAQLLQMWMGLSSELALTTGSAISLTMGDVQIRIDGSNSRLTIEVATHHFSPSLASMQFTHLEDLDWELVPVDLNTITGMPNEYFQICGSQSNDGQLLGNNNSVHHNPYRDAFAFGFSRANGLDALSRDEKSIAVGDMNFIAPDQWAFSRLMFLRELLTGM